MWPLSSFSQVVDTSRKTEEQKKDFYTNWLNEML